MTRVVLPIVIAMGAGVLGSAVATAAPSPVTAVGFGAATIDMSMPEFLKLDGRSRARHCPRLRITGAQNAWKISCWRDRLGPLRDVATDYYFAGATDGGPRLVALSVIGKSADYAVTLRYLQGRFGPFLSAAERARESRVRDPANGRVLGPGDDRVWRWGNIRLSLFHEDGRAYPAVPKDGILMLAIVKKGALPSAGPVK